MLKPCIYTTPWEGGYPQNPYDFRAPRDPFFGHFWPFWPIAAYSRQEPPKPAVLGAPPPAPRGREKKKVLPPGGSPREPPRDRPAPPAPGEFPHLTAQDLTAHRPSWGMFRLPLRLRSPPEARYRSTRPSGGARRSMTRGALRSERRSYAPCSLSMLACCCPRQIAASAGCSYEHQRCFVALRPSRI